MLKFRPSYVVFENHSEEIYTCVTYKIPSNGYDFCKARDYRQKVVVTVTNQRRFNDKKQLLIAQL